MAARCEEPISARTATAATSLKLAAGIGMAEASRPVKHVYSCGHSSHLREVRCPGCGRGLLIQRHADHGPEVICRPAGFGLCEAAPLIDYLDRRALPGSETAATREAE